MCVNTMSVKNDISNILRKATVAVHQSGKVCRAKSVSRSVARRKPLLSQRNMAARIKAASELCKPKTHEAICFQQKNTKWQCFLFIFTVPVLNNLIAYQLELGNIRTNQYHD